MAVAAKTPLQPSQEETVYASSGNTVPALAGSHPDRSTQTAIAPTRPPAAAHDSLQVPGVEHRSVDDEALIESVETLAATIKPELADAPSEIKSQLESWAELHGMPATDDTTRELIATQAAFAHLLKATLYEFHHQRGDLPALSRPMRAAFRAAGDRLATPAFDECVLDELVYLADANNRDRVVDERTRLLDATQPTEDIGRLYEAVVPREYRQTLGQFRTPQPLADLVKSWAIHDDACVLDPGVGAGALTSPRHPDWELSTEPEHVHGIDRSKLSILMAATAQTLLGQSHTLHHTDFLNPQPTDLRDSVDAVIANPPFTQGSDLPASYNKRVNEQFEDVTGIEISGQSPLFTYVASYGIEREHLSPLLRKPSLVDGYDFTTDNWRALQAADKPVWVLTPEVPSAPESIHEYTSQLEGATQLSTDEGVLAYLRDGVVEYDLAEVNAVAQRSCWYRPRQRPVPRVMVQYAGREELRFVLNETDARILNSAYGLYDVTLAEEELKAMLAYLHSTVGQQTVNQITGARHGDLQGFGVTDLRDLPVIDPRELDDETVAELADAFDDLCTAARHDDGIEAAREAIDAVLQSKVSLQ